METIVLTIWLTRADPMVSLPMPDQVTCLAFGRLWYASASRWALRSGVRESQPGYLCGEVRVQL
jgi:hypothetical protein